MLDPTKLIPEEVVPDPSGADEGFVSFDDYPPAEFVARCRLLRHWDRQRATVV